MNAPLLMIVADGVGSERVVQRHHNHRVRVARQLRDDPLRTHETSTSSASAHGFCSLVLWCLVLYLGPVLCKHPDELIRIGLTSLRQQTGAQELGAAEHLRSGHTTIRCYYHALLDVIKQYMITTMYLHSIIDL